MEGLLNLPFSEDGTKRIVLRSLPKTETVYQKQRAMKGYALIVPGLKTRVALYWMVKGIWLSAGKNFSVGGGGDNRPLFSKQYSIVCIILSFVLN